MSKQKSLAKNTIIIFLGKFSTQFLSFFLLPLYTSYLSTGDYGLVDLIITYISLLVPIITIEQEMAVFRFLIEARGNKKRTKEILNSSFSIVIAFSLFFLLFYLLITHFISLQYKWLILVNILICIFSNFFLQIARGLGKNLNFSIASFITGVITILSNIILIRGFGIAAEGILISMAFANLCCILYLFWTLKLHQYISLSDTSKKQKKELIKYSVPLIPNSISWWIINVSDRTIISAFIGVASNGIFAISSKFPTIISSIFSIFSMSWTESASLHINDRDRDEFFSSIANTILQLFSSLCIGLIACMPFLFSILIGNHYYEAYSYIPILLIGSMCSCIVGIYSAIYIAKKMTKQVATTSLLSALINIITNLLFIHFIGLYAAALSTAIAYFVMMIYRHYDVKKYVKISYQKKTVFFTIFMFSISMILYYINNLIGNILNLLMAILYATIMNKKLLKNIIHVMREKFLKGNNGKEKVCC